MLTNSIFLHIVNRAIGDKPLQLTATKRENEYLSWCDDVGIGYYPVVKFPYDKEYYERYIDLESSPLSDSLNQARIDLVNQVYDGDSIVDVGIGSGLFCKTIDCFGFDVNPHGIQWLKDTGRYVNPYTQQFDVLTMWDVIEHIQDPLPLLSNARKYVVLSCPVYTGFENILNSKHFRPDEHCWYWTERGLEIFMDNFGFETITLSYVETYIGRDSIITGIFKRKGS